ncbi:hypothetical protein HO173_011292 [Letharia columbiana]|uniref:Uncharacterized protein n=1 Tax=Letharia columbiana TaxID=112416 RepID=A0A8H6FJQ2_9LECA|nr:uncharacterized protein HO173_012398 [Letharia columbiana]XP_037159968.1 uncharacterized protein HO173_011292 [Letharia columbiana]KAF6226652.1 hypothetical protein HO173_012398 [Letharia columbiana]KAF6229776.1 hypothetical protein HO173_011292 [Letharia columbiana]
MGQNPPLPPPYLEDNLKLAAELKVPRRPSGHVSMKSHHCGKCHGVFKQTCIDAKHMVLCLKHKTYSKWEGQCPPCEREWKTQEKEIKEAEAALKADKEQEEAQATKISKKTKKTGKDGKKLGSKCVPGWVEAKKGDRK